MRGVASAQSGVELSRGERVESAYLEFALGPEGSPVMGNELGKRSSAGQTLSKEREGGERLTPQHEENGCSPADSLQGSVGGQDSA